MEPLRHAYFGRVMHIRRRQIQHHVRARTHPYKNARIHNDKKNKNKCSTYCPAFPNAWPWPLRHKHSHCGIHGASRQIQHLEHVASRRDYIGRWET